MINTDNYIIGGILTAIPVIIYIIETFAKEFIANLAKNIFKSKNKKSALLIFNFTISVLFIAGILIILNNYLKQEKANNETIVEIHQKSDAEVILEGTELGIELIKEGVEKHREKKEEIIKNRGKRLVYQIGAIKDNEEIVFETYQRLTEETNLDSSKIKVFAIKRNKFLLFYEIAGTEAEIYEQFEYYKEIIMPAETNVTIEDLYSHCSAKEIIVDSKPLKQRKYEYKIPKCGCEK